MVTLKLVLLLCVGFVTARPPVKRKESKHEIQADYIVTFKSEFDLTETTSDVVKQFPHFKVIPKLQYVYEKVVHGIALQGVSKEALDWLDKQVYIDYIEKSEEWTQNSCSISSPSEPIAYSNQFNWGLDRIDEQPYPISGWDYTPSGDGTGVNIYIVDSGIQADHDQFSNVVALSTGVTCSNNDNHHGTWVAGVAAATNFGTAKGAKLVDVKVACASASTKDIATGLDKIAIDVTSSVKCVVVISYTTLTNYTSVESAMTVLHNEGCIIVAAAGNQGESALYYPAAYSEVISVGAVNANNKKPCFSNYGPTVDIYAPGTNIWTTDQNSTATNMLVKVTGTSFAAPFVAGVAAIHLGLGVSASNVNATIMSDAITSAISNLPSQSHNRILYVD
ncbi:thermitase-like [Apostichopus japonicus]|uniref:thermitase-like n=1 Tax=Stichopus japonicus TaxID=307972 RepID=UPI003AB29D3F